VTKITKLPPANCYKYPYRGYGQGSNKFYKELRANRDSYKRFRIKLLKEQNYKCAYCKTSLENRVANIEHVLALKKGGSNDIENLVMACPDCNKAKGNKLLKKPVRLAVKTEAQAYGRQSRKEHEEQVKVWEEIEEDMIYELKTMF
jgi:5-methylcytosine-specific restriction endonuclease McrA